MINVNTLFITEDMLPCVREISIKYVYWKNVGENLVLRYASENVSSIDKILIAPAKG